MKPKAHAQRSVLPTRTKSRNESQVFQVNAEVQRYIGYLKARNAFELCLGMSSSAVWNAFSVVRSTPAIYIWKQ